MVSVLFGLASFVLLPSSPASLSILSEHEKKAVSYALDTDGIVQLSEVQERNSSLEIKQALLQPHIVVLATAGFFSGESDHT